MYTLFGGRKSSSFLAFECYAVLRVKLPPPASAQILKHKNSGALGIERLSAAHTKIPTTSTISGDTNHFDYLMSSDMLSAQPKSLPQQSYLSLVNHYMLHLLPVFKSVLLLNLRSIIKKIDS